MALQHQMILSSLNTPNTISYGFWLLSLLFRSSEVRTKFNQ